MYRFSLPIRFTLMIVLLLAAVACDDRTKGILTGPTAAIPTTGAATTDASPTAMRRPQPQPQPVPAAALEGTVTYNVAFRYGQAVGATVRIVNEKDTVVAQTTTQARGLYQTRVPKGVLVAIATATINGVQVSGKSNPVVVTDSSPSVIKGVNILMSSSSGR